MGALVTKTGIVLKKTKLKETDVILTILSQEGDLVQGIVKGARNPRSKTVGKAELFSEEKFAFVQGKSLSIITESTIIDAHKPLIEDYDLTLAASVIVEIALKTSTSENPHERFFLLTQAALRALETHPKQAYALLVGFFIKALSLQGYQPVLEVCASCFEEKDLTSWSHMAGGAVCQDCAERVEAFEVPPQLLKWAQFFLMSTFEEIASESIEKGVLDDCSHLLARFFEYVFQSTLKSLPIFWEIAQ